MMIIDGESLILGRVGSYAAKAALNGEEVRIVNCEKIVVSGDRRLVLAREKERRGKKGYPLKSQKFSRLADRMVRKTVRGMLPFKTARGREAFKRVKCYAGVPEEFKGKEKKLEKAKAEKLPTLNQVTIGEISNWLRGKQA